jgi:hypothetical protein
LSNIYRREDIGAHSVFVAGHADPLQYLINFYHVTGNESHVSAKRGKRHHRHLCIGGPADGFVTWAFPLRKIRGATYRLIVIECAGHTAEVYVCGTLDVARTLIDGYKEDAHPMDGGVLRQAFAGIHIKTSNGDDQ